MKIRPSTLIVMVVTAVMVFSLSCGESTHSSSDEVLLTVYVQNACSIDIFPVLVYLDGTLFGQINSWGTASGSAAQGNVTIGTHNISATAHNGVTWAAYPIELSAGVPFAYELFCTSSGTFGTAKNGPKK